MLVPEDVTDLKNQGNLLINLDELANLFRRRGPDEQFFFIDACRDIPERDFTSIGPLGWTGLQPGPERAQAVLFAVAEQGQARSQQEGMGVMSRHLFDALDGQGLARDFSDKDSQYVVTAQSLRDYVRQRVLEVNDAALEATVFVATTTRPGSETRADSNASPTRCVSAHPC